LLRTHYIEEAKGKVGSEVTVAGWAHEVRDIGKIKFILLRDRSGIIQVTAKTGTSSPDILGKMVHPKETVLSITGTVLENKIAPDGVELIPTRIDVIGPVSIKVPFEVTGKVPADMEVRLDNRHVDLRRDKTAAIFKVKSEVLRAFREKAMGLGFQEIVTPFIVSAATEGGTALFKLMYFERGAFLAQSPQLYKQLAVIGGMDRVFMTVPAFRAEKHNTPTHLNEVLQMDIEVGFADHEDAMNFLESFALHILNSVQKNCKKELGLLESNIPVPEKINRYKYSHIIELLKKNNVPVEWGKDFSAEQKKRIAELIGDELYFIYEWPTIARAFYSMPREDNPDFCNAYDLMWGEVEIAGGAQRAHSPEILLKQLKLHGLDEKDFEFYVNAFKVGAPPHAGWSIGLERITMKLCNQHNIRECALFPRDRTRITP